MNWSKGNDIVVHWRRLGRRRLRQHKVIGQPFDQEPIVLFAGEGIVMATEPDLLAGDLYECLAATVATQLGKGGGELGHVYIRKSGARTTDSSATPPRAAKC
jgi:hypothetical protein